MNGTNRLQEGCVRVSMKNLYVAIAVALMGFAPAISRGQGPAPVGRLVSIAGGQKIHLHCVGSGSPTVVFEGGSGDFSVIWWLVQSRVGRVTRACSYDLAGFAWSDPGRRPRTFSQMALELHETLKSAKIAGPYVLVGQSFGGSLVRGFANRYAKSVAGMVLVDAIHEDGYVVWGGQPHHLRDEAQGRVEPKPILGLDTANIRMSRNNSKRRGAADPSTARSHAGC